MFQSDPTQTAARIAALDRYLTTNVMTPGILTCTTGLSCRKSHQGDFIAGQLHHVGRHYDLVRDDKPFRVAVAGQEYGHGPAFVTLTQRNDMIVRKSGMESRFKADGGFQARNPHMRGCTSLLRLIFCLDLGADREGEFLRLGTERVHVFECFALVNFLLCSAVAAGEGGISSERLGGKPGQSTDTMRANCGAHFRAALDALEPTLVVAQGYGVRRWIARAYGLRAPRPADLIEQLPCGGGVATLVSFSHPSAHGALNWGLNERMPYLLNTVAPTIRRLMGECR